MVFPSTKGNLPTGGKLIAAFVFGTLSWVGAAWYHTDKPIKSEFRKLKFQLHRIQQKLFDELRDDMRHHKSVPPSYDAMAVEDFCMRLEEKDTDLCRDFFTEYYETVVDAATRRDHQTIMDIDKVDFLAMRPQLKTIGRNTQGRKVMNKFRDIQIQPIERSRTIDEEAV